MIIYRNRSKNGRNGKPVAKIGKLEGVRKLKTSLQNTRLLASAKNNTIAIILAKGGIDVTQIQH